MAKKKKTCEDCTHSRFILSENSYTYQRICTLSQESAINCIVKGYSEFENKFKKGENKIE